MSMNTLDSFIADIGRTLGQVIQGGVSAAGCGEYKFEMFNGQIVISKPVARMLEAAFHIARGDHVMIDYTNWRGERGVREIAPERLLFNHVPNKWHPQPCWLVAGRDMGKGASRTFALENIHAWLPVSE